jgi:hypothetical protein
MRQNPCDALCTSPAGPAWCPGGRTAQNTFRARRCGTGWPAQSVGAAGGAGLSPGVEIGWSKGRHAVKT